MCRILLYISTLYFAKTAVLLHILELAINESHRAISIVVGVFIAIWSVTAIFPTSCRCSPLHTKSLKGAYHNGKYYCISVDLAKSLINFSLSASSAGLYAKVFFSTSRIVGTITRPSSINRVLDNVLFRNPLMNINESAMTTICR